MTTIEDRYLGDGVYASFDGYHIVLDLRGQDDSTRIALEPAVFSELIQFALSNNLLRWNTPTLNAEAEGDPHPSGGTLNAAEE